MDTMSQHVFTKDDGSQLKTIYHSAFCSLVGRQIQFVSPPADSKFAGNLPYAKFKIAGDPGVYSLQIDNDGIREALQNVPLNQTLTVVDAGGREDSAFLKLSAGGNGTAAPPTNPQSQTPQGQGGQPQQRPSSSAPVAVSFRAKTVMIDMKEALVAAHRLSSWYEQSFGRPMTAVEQDLAATLLIQFYRGDCQRPMDLIDDERSSDLEDVIHESSASEPVKRALMARLNRGVQPYEAREIVQFLTPEDELPDENPIHAPDDDVPSADDLPF
jgi:hypothetical protein